MTFNRHDYFKWSRLTFFFCLFWNFFLHAFFPEIALESEKIFIVCIFAGLLWPVYAFLWTTIVMLTPILGACLLILALLLG